MGTTVHEIGEGFKNKIVSGTSDFCFDKQGHCIMKLKDFTKIITKFETGYVSYQDSISFFYDLDHQKQKVYAISFSRTENLPERFDYIQFLFTKHGRAKPLHRTGKLFDLVEKCLPNWELEEVQQSSSILKQFDSLRNSIGGIFSSKSSMTQSTVNSSSISNSTSKGEFEQEPRKRSSASVFDSLKSFGQKTRAALKQGPFKQRERKEKN